MDGSGSYTSTATILFTDLAGSTAQRAALGEELADELRRRHDALLLGTIERHRGRVVKGGGDGVMATFDAAADGIAAAVAIQQAFDLHNRRSDRIAPLSVRIGLSTGDVSWEDGDGFGMPVIEAARLEEAAEQGTILCSDFVRISSRGRGGHEFRAVGDLELKGIADAIPTSEVLWQPVEGPARPLPQPLVSNWDFPFVGRSRLVRDVERFLSEQKGSAVLWLTGEAGAGKTRLASVIAQRAHQAGAFVMYGRADEDLRLPMGPFVEAFRGSYESATAVPPGDAELSSLFTEADVRSATEQNAESVPGTQVSVLSSVGDWLLHACQVEPLVVVLDDLHWATEQTIRLLRYLLLRPTHPGPTFVLTTRAGQISSSLAELMSGSQHATPAMICDLPPLAVDDLVAMAGIDDATAEAVRGETGGNALYATLVLKALKDGRPLESVTAPGVLDRFLSSLSGRAVGLLRIAALAGSEFDSRAVAAVAGLDHETAVNELEIACQIGVVAEVAANTFRFVHSLLRTTLRAEIGPTRAAQVHRDLGGAIERLDLRPTDQRISALAYHFRQAAYGDLCLDEAAEYAKEAGETAIRQFAYEDAARYFLDAATFIERKHRETPTSTELRIRSARALHATGDHASASAQLVDAATTADRHGWTAELAKAAIDMQGVMTAQGRTTTEAIALLEKASQAVESEAPSLHPNVVARLAAAYRFAGRTDDATGAARRAMELAEGSDDPATWTVVSDSVHTVFDSPETITPRIVAATRAINASRSAGLHEELSWELWRRTVDNVDLGQLRDARLDLHQLSSNTTTHKQRFMHQLAVTAGSMMAFIDDQLDLAERLALEAEDLRSELEGDQAEGILGIQMYTIRRAQGRLGELAPVIRTLASSPEGSWGPGLANLYSELGMTEEARHLLEQYVDDTGVGLPKDDRWRLSVSYLADACHAAADATRAATLYQELRPHERTWLSFGGVACVGPAARYLGSLALTMGLTDEARHHLQAAREAAQAADSPRFVLEADRWLARLRAGDK